MKTRAHGFSLIELSIALVILGILLLAAAPGFSAWMRNTQIRTAAEALRDGLQLARGEAVRRNTSIRFQLTNNLSSDCVLQPTGTASEPKMQNLPRRLRHASFRSVRRMRVQVVLTP